MVDSGTRTPTTREVKKAERRSELLAAAATLFADRGFAGVRLEDLGAAVGISGPAVYRHFPNKEAVLVELLVDISEYLLAGGQRVAATAAEPAQILAELVDFHLDFALESPALIRIQDRDLQSLPEAARRTVRRKQREYVEIWVGVLREFHSTRELQNTHELHSTHEFQNTRELHSTMEEADARTTAHAAFGLMNSTPFSANRTVSTRSRVLLRAMTIGALALN
ncbi:TetR/AcrR family transcriptional regulator [Rhodococcoides yunnanense]|uniref:TetR/AcrR family transcriptional regulator n=1 Tax=Rhodococcoides yunnanense TaxID=278209 RepID=UPI000934ECDD|nr:TetR/AcrR family transcriptional regulator [Rhodococcus yunnanensis]